MARMPHRILLACSLLASLTAFAAEPVDAKQLVGVPAMKQNEKAKMTVEGGALVLKFGKSTSEIKASSIENVYTGTETTQGGGRPGSAAKMGAIAAPYGTGAVLVLILRTKVDMLTVLYRGEAGELHSALFAVTKGQADGIKAQLVAAGAKAPEGMN